MKAFAPDLLIYHPKSFGAPHLAAALGVPHMLASPLPGFTPTADFPSPLLPFTSLGPLNKISHILATRSAELLFRKELQEWKERTLGLARGGRPASPLGTLYAYSPKVVPKPADWGDDVVVAGYWFLDNPDWSPDPGLSAFLASGDQPIYVGFGSMPGIDPQELTAMVVEALSRTGKRGLLATGGGALVADTMYSHAYMVSNVPHDRILPLVSAAIHHGGAGTTAASLRAGLPTTIMPFLGDQPFWGRRVEQLGVGPRALDRKTLSIESIAEAIFAMEAPVMRQSAEAVGIAIRAENGIRAAADFIERSFERQPKQHP